MTLICNQNSPLFTIFTPTYNRARTLHRVFDSLSKQTFVDFEWLVVDDGSTDDTADDIADWAARAKFPVRYVRQEHAGKHVAHNRALVHARGALFGILDSDDALTPNALERAAHHWASIPDSDKDTFCGIEGLCCDRFGKVVGDRYPQEPFDTTFREQMYVHRIRGEKWGVNRTAVLRQYPFPEVAGTQFVPEGMVWLQIADRYRLRAVNDVLRVYFTDDADGGDALSRRRGLRVNAAGRLCYYTWLLDNELPHFFQAPLPFLKAATVVPILARYQRKPLVPTLRSLNRPFARLLTLLALPLSILLYALDRAKERCARSATTGQKA